MRRCLIALLFSALAVIGGCAGGSSSSGPPPTPTPPPGTTSSQINPPVVIGLAPGQAASGADIIVPLATASPAPNALVLGVSSGGGGTAFNTGATIARGATKMILMFGPDSPRACRFRFPARQISPFHVFSPSPPPRGLLAWPFRQSSIPMLLWARAPCWCRTRRMTSALLPAVSR